MGALGIAGIAGIFIALFVGVASVGGLTSERRQIGRSLQALEAVGTAPQSMRSEVDVPFADRVVTPFLARLTSLARRMSSDGREADLQRRLDLAGSPADWDVDRVLAVKVLGLVVGVLFGVLATFALGIGALPAVVVVLGLGAFGYWGPNLALYQAAYNRTDR
ncbi:MAG: Bacterial type secretion system protein domain protein, partial [Frankiales bacterium]|nr:Bacterial type secretion system protein domain protein [Frankiales bacterium]